MSTAGRLSAFAITALLALGAGAAIGAAVGPIDAPTPERAPTPIPHMLRSEGASHRAGSHP